MGVKASLKGSSNKTEMWFRCYRELSAVRKGLMSSAASTLKETPGRADRVWRGKRQGCLISWETGAVTCYCSLVGLREERYIHFGGAQSAVGYPS